MELSTAFTAQLKSICMWYYRELPERGSRLVVTKLSYKLAVAVFSGHSNLLIFTPYQSSITVLLILHSAHNRSFTSSVMLKRYERLHRFTLRASMVQANVRDPDPADSLERFERLLLHGRQQLDAPSNP